jgi:5'-nucleotidase
VTGHILLVNDDGIDSPGLQCLFTRLETSMADRFIITLVAPTRQRSWISKASSYRREMSVEIRRSPEISPSPGADRFPRGGIYALDGTPADCVVAGIYHLCPGKPDLVISGINTGANVGDSYILSSGTVGGAVEAALAGIPALAVGMEFGHDRTQHLETASGPEEEQLFSGAADITVKIAYILSELLPRLGPLVFNLNMPEEVAPEAPLSVTVPARYGYGSYLEPVKGGFTHHGAAKDYSLVSSGTDMAALREGHISLSLIDLIAGDTRSSDPRGREILEQIAASYAGRETSG